MKHFTSVMLTLNFDKECIGYIECDVCCASHSVKLATTFFCVNLFCF